MKTTEVTLEIGAIRDVPTLHVRRCLNPETVGEYALALEDAVVFPPILVATVRGAPTLVDGRHRLAAARATRATAIRALTFDATTEEAACAAVRANLPHGLPLSRGERSRALKMLLRAGGHRRPEGGVTPLHALALEFGVSPVTIGLQVSRDTPKIYRTDFSGPTKATVSPQRDPFTLALELLQAASVLALGVPEDGRRKALADAGKAFVEGL